MKKEAIDALQQQNLQRPDEPEHPAGELDGRPFPSLAKPISRIKADQRGKDDDEPAVSGIKAENVGKDPDDAPTRSYSLSCIRNEQVSNSGLPNINSRIRKMSQTGSSGRFSGCTCIVSSGGAVGLFSSVGAVCCPSMFGYRCDKKTAFVNAVTVRVRQSGAGRRARR